MRYNNLLKAVTLIRLNHNHLLCRATSTSTTNTSLTLIRGGGGDNSDSNSIKSTIQQTIRSYSNQPNNNLPKTETHTHIHIHTPKASFTTTKATMTEDDNKVWSINEDDNGNAFADLSHIGYSLQSDPVHQTGGWLAHRLAQQTNVNSNGEEETTDTSDTTTRTIDNQPPHCWVRDEVATKLTKFNYNEMPIGRSPRILILYGSLRPSSFSKKLAFEFARILETLGCDVRTYNPHRLPVRDPSLEADVKVQELRSLTLWSDGHVWVTPEMHGQLTGVFKNQIDWIPLNTGSVRPTQGRTVCLAQVNGGSQSFNAVNTLRLLARWMRMPCCTNQSSVPKAWQEFDDNGRMKDSSYRDRVIDVAEEFAKFTAVMAPVSDDLVNRYSERKEKEKEGRLLTQAEKESKKTITEARKG